MRELPLILHLDIAGQPQRWITYEQSAYYLAKDLVGWSMGEIEFTIYGGTQRLTGVQSTLTMNTIIAIKGKAAKPNLRLVPALTNKALFRRDQNMCAYCGVVFPSTKLTRDHVTPTSAKGRNVWSNVVTACGHCNKIKDDKTVEQAHLELLYIPYTPNRAEWLILNNRRILADQMQFLLKQVTSDSRLRRKRLNKH